MSSGVKKYLLKCCTILLGMYYFHVMLLYTSTSPHFRGKHFRFFSLVTLVLVLEDQTCASQPFDPL